MYCKEVVVCTTWVGRYTSVLEKAELCQSYLEERLIISDAWKLDTRHFRFAFYIGSKS